MLEFEKMFISFFIFSILGWLIEEADILIKFKKIVNRGFLIGPYCPIYGLGYIFITFFLTKFKSYPVELFINAVVICSILEYLTSYFMEKLFNARWWDYSYRKFNVNGRICLVDSFLFGILGIIIIYFINPIYIKIFSLLSSNVINVIFIVVFMLFFIDVFLSIKIMLKIKNEFKHLDKDDTNEIKKLVFKKLNINMDITSKIKKSTITNFKNEKMVSRILKAFPNFTPVTKVKNKKNKNTIKK